jgi:hypothetical protein
MLMWIGIAESVTLVSKTRPAWVSSPAFQRLLLGPPKAG